MVSVTSGNRSCGLGHREDGNRYGRGRGCGAVAILYVGDRVVFCDSAEDRRVLEDSNRLRHIRIAGGIERAGRILGRSTPSTGACAIPM